MCERCGCDALGTAKKEEAVPRGTHEHWHVHVDGTAHSHPHGHEHGSGHAHRDGKRPPGDGSSARRPGTKGSS